VLQRIGVCGFAATCILLAGRGAGWWGGFTAALVLGSALWSLYVPIPGCGRPDLAIPPDPAGEAAAVRCSNWCAWLDTRVFGGRCHQVGRDPTTGAVVWAFDPEGLGSTPGALATVLMGAGVGRWLFPRGPRARRTAGRLLLCGVGGMIVGALLDRWIPINKQLWTSSFALFTGGAACVAFAGCMQLPEAGALGRVLAPCVWYGRNALVLFLGSSLCATLSLHLRVPGGLAADGTPRLIPWKLWVYARLCEHLTPIQASLLHALGVVVVWAAVAGVLVRRRIFIKL
jgi:predicted acyltransferase